MLIELVLKIFAIFKFPFFLKIFNFNVSRIKVHVVDFDVWNIEVQQRTCSLLFVILLNIHSELICRVQIIKKSLFGNF